MPDSRMGFYGQYRSSDHWQWARNGLCPSFRSITENIAFGIPVTMVDHDRVHQAAKQAQIESLIESWPQKYQTRIGERGINLSGGQRQRIGIARALYKQAKETEK